VVNDGDASDRQSKNAAMHRRIVGDGQVEDAVGGGDRQAADGRGRLGSSRPSTPVARPSAFTAHHPAQRFVEA
jgi:hypothetical protein